ncbi:MAG TPA: carbohydrate ABC transporter permease, partial [Bacillota bacterium]|nr:carbohydrate ABC transporter permease [Bacillota bacterium]
MKNNAAFTKNIVNYLFLSVVSFIVLLPFFWMFTTSLKDPNNIFLFPPQWFPNPIRWQNFIELFERIPFHIQMFNSVYIATATTVGTCIFGAMGGYAFAKLKFKFKNIIFLCLLSSIMIPTEATVIPLFVWFSKLKLVNTHIALIIPPMLGAAGMFGVFLMRQFFITVPDALIEAAKIDGCGPARTFFMVMLP